MLNEATLEQRLAELEREVAQIKRQLMPPASNGNWVDEISGSMQSIPEFEEAVRYGKEFRRAAEESNS